MTPGTPANPPVFLGHVVIGGVLECRTGLHVGGNRDSLVIGGLDLPVARDPATRMPVIPGSSLKGRLRALLEMLRGKVRFERGTAARAEGAPDAIERLFGAPSGAGAAPGTTRLVVRDALPLEPAGEGRKDRAPERNTVNWWRMLETDGLGSEVKAEAAINRVTATAEPRQVERVLAGSRFRLEFVLSVFEGEPQDEELLKELLIGLRLLEDTWLGGHGSRGSGRVAVRLQDQPAVVTRNDYEHGRRRGEPAGELKTLDELDGDALVAHVRARLRAGE